jgi:hypothetical protein
MWGEKVSFFSWLSNRIWPQKRISKLWRQSLEHYMCSATAETDETDSVPKILSMLINFRFQFTTKILKFETEGNSHQIDFSYYFQTYRSTHTRTFKSLCHKTRTTRIKSITHSVSISINIIQNRLQSTTKYIDPFSLWSQCWKMDEKLYFFNFNFFVVLCTSQQLQRWVLLWDWGVVDFEEKIRMKMLCIIYACIMYFENMYYL